MKTYSGMALGVCLACDLIWSLGILAVTAYVVFWRDQSGWWFVLAIFLCSCWNCKSYRSPEQIAANKDDCKC